MENGYLPVESSVLTLIDKINSLISNGEKWFSFEFFPPRTTAGAANLINRFETMNKTGPLFCDITWHEAGNPTSDKPTSSMKIAETMIHYCGLETVLHITCCNSSKETIRDCLNRAKACGIRNLVALRGDPPVGKQWKAREDGFAYAVELVQFIRQEFGSYFTICVAGYPNKHPEANSYEADLQNLKNKVDAGADFIITQLFFKAKDFINFVKDCRQIGITVPIIPGIMPIQSYSSLRSLVKLSGLDVPADIQGAIEPIKEDDRLIRSYGISQAVSLIREIFSSGICDRGVHFYTLNREYATMEIVKEAGLLSVDPISRTLPWKHCSTDYRRASEEVRPIFWSLRPKSYVHRTREWDDFPNGRWGDSRSPAFGLLTDYHLFYLKQNCSHKDLLSMYGETVESLRDVGDTFSSFISGTLNRNGHHVTMLPWCEKGALQPETECISDRLSSLNCRGVLTINSQPNINCVDSSDNIYGWGAPGGYVFQKAYVEFFVSIPNAWNLLSILKQHPRITYHFIDKTGSVDVTNMHRNIPTAVTWGVFIGKEIIQPTVVDPEAFSVWKDEAFALWYENWGNLYEDGSPSWQVISDIAENFLLVNLVDNDFPNKTILWDILEQMLDTECLSNESDIIDSLVSISTPFKSQTLSRNISAQQLEEMPS